MVGDMKLAFYDQFLVREAIQRPLRSIGMFMIKKNTNPRQNAATRRCANRSAASGAAGLILALGVAISGCSPIVNVRGYVPQPNTVEQLEIGKQNKEQVYDLLGSPSTRATFDEDTWYYISSRTERRGFFEEKTVARSILAVKFDGEERVSEIANYGLEDGQVVNFVGRTTPTRGKELTFLEQMFGNIGGIPAGAIEE